MTSSVRKPPPFSVNRGISSSTGWVLRSIYALIRAQLCFSILGRLLAAGRVILPDRASPVAGGSVVPQIKLRGGNLQVNNPASDYNQIFPGFRPFVRATQSEVSTAAFGRNIVVTFNDSTGIHVSPNPAGPGLIVDRVQISGFATSNDGGRTWTRGSLWSFLDACTFPITWTQARPARHLFNGWKGV